MKTYYYVRGITDEMDRAVCLRCDTLLQAQKWRALAASMLKPLSNAYWPLLKIEIVKY